MSTIDIEHKLLNALLSIDSFAATRLLTVETASWTPMDRIEKLIAPVLKRIGEEWEEGRIALSQVYMSGRICENVVETILPPDSPGQKDHPKIAVVTLLDHHGLGKRILSSVLHSVGFKLVDLGQGVPVDAVVDKVKREGVRILFVSTLMLQSALQVRNLTDRLKKAGLNVRIIVGGAPFLFDPALWKEVGADGMAGTASEAISLIEGMEKRAEAA